MATGQGKVSPGDPLQISATSWNSFVDAAEANKDRQHDRRPRPLPRMRQACIFPIQNSTGADRGRFEIVGISDVVISPTDNDLEFKGGPALVGAAVADAHAGNFAILLEPIGTGKIGLCVLAGVTPVQIDITDADHGWADVKDGDATQLQSGESGGGQILWVEAGTGTKWAIVRLGPSIEATALAVRHGCLVVAHTTGKELSVYPADEDGVRTPPDAAAIWLHASFDRKVVNDPYAVDDVVQWMPYTIPFDDIGTGHTVVGVVVGPHQGTAATPHEMDWTWNWTDAYTDTWSRAAQPVGKDGVLVKITRHVDDGQYNLIFTRDFTFDSHGHLLAISAETLHAY